MDAEEFHQRQTVNLRHDQVLKDHRRLKGGGGRNGLRGILAERKDNVRLRFEHFFHRRADNRLVVDEQDLDFMGGQCACRIVAAGRGRV